jgi:hypothetical protein
MSPLNTHSTYRRPLTVKVRVIIALGEIPMSAHRGAGEGMALGLIGWGSISRPRKNQLSLSVDTHSLL